MVFAWTRSSLIWLLISFFSSVGLNYEKMLLTFGPAFSHAINDEICEGLDEDSGVGDEEVAIDIFEYECSEDKGAFRGRLFGLSRSQRWDGCRESNMKGCSPYRLGFGFGMHYNSSSAKFV